MKVRGFITRLSIVALLLCFAASAFAAEDWKAKQDEMFSKIGLKPGDTIDTSNWEKIKDVLPFSMVEWVKKGDLPITVGEFKFDARPDENWRKACSANAGKYAIDETGALIDAKTKEVPQYVYGEPFPIESIDFANDPTAGAQIIWNYDLKRGRVGTWNSRFSMTWIGRSGFEKKIIGDFFVYYYNCRPDGEQDNPQGFLELSLFPVVEPYDVQGLVQLNRKFIADKADDVYAYIPAIRRVKKLSGANRSDPSVGSDFILDDSNGWSGKNTSMEWKFIKKTIALVPMNKWALEKPLGARKLGNGAYHVEDGREPPIEGFMDPNWTGAPWVPTNLLWAPREVYVVEALAKDPYYNYGKCLYYIDPYMGIFYKVIYNKAKEYWKTMWLMPMIVDYNEGDKFQRNLGSSITWYATVDEKTDHATTAPCYGHYRGDVFSTKFEDPDLIPSMYAPNQIATMTR